MTYRFSEETWHKDPNRDQRLDWAILLGTDFDVYLEIVDREILLDLGERTEHCRLCDHGHLPEDPCFGMLAPPDHRPPHPG